MTIRTDAEASAPRIERAELILATPATSAGSTATVEIRDAKQER